MIHLSRKPPDRKHPGYKELCFDDVATPASFNPLSGRRNHKAKFSARTGNAAERRTNLLFGIGSSLLVSLFLGVEATVLLLNLPT